MENVTPTGVGVVVIGTVLILRLVFDFIVKMKEAKVPLDRQDILVGFTQKDRTRLYDLYRWHDRMDEDGVPVWYVRAGLENSVKELCKAIEQLVKTQESSTRAIEYLYDKARDDHDHPLSRAGTQS